MTTTLYKRDLPGNISGDPKKCFHYLHPSGWIRNGLSEVIATPTWTPPRPSYPIAILPEGGAWYDCPNGGRYFLDWLPWGSGYIDPDAPPDEPPIVPPADPDDPEDPTEDEKDFMRQEWEWVTIGYDKDGNQFLERKLVTQWYEKVATLEEGG